METQHADRGAILRELLLAPPSVEAGGTSLQGCICRGAAMIHSTMDEVRSNGAAARDAVISTAPGDFPQEEAARLVAELVAVIDEAELRKRSALEAEAVAADELLATCESVCAEALILLDGVAASGPASTGIDAAASARVIAALRQLHVEARLLAAGPAEPSMIAFLKRAAGQPPCTAPGCNALGCICALGAFSAADVCLEDAPSWAMPGCDAVLLLGLRASYVLLQSPDGRTPLHCAAKSNACAAARVLLEAGADPSARTQARRGADRVHEGSR
jgi:hypothetical protein